MFQQFKAIYLPKISDVNYWGVIPVWNSVCGSLGFGVSLFGQEPSKKLNKQVISARTVPVQKTFFLMWSGYFQLLQKFWTAAWIIPTI